MTKKLISVALIIIFFATRTAIVFGQSNSWSSVQSLPLNTKIKIELKNGKKMDGKLKTVTDSSLTFTKNNNDVLVNSEEIKRLYQVQGKSRGKSAITGAVIGGASGAGIGVGIYAPARDDIEPAVVPIFGLIGADIGALIGYLFGKGEKKTLVYEIP